MASETLVTAIAALIGLGIVTMAMLTAWQGWLQLKLRELDRRPQRAEPDSAPPAIARIELADVKERLRRLEAIAAGVEL